MLKELRSGYTVTNLGGVEYSIGPNSDFTNADLRGLDLSQTDLHGSIFAGADLSFTELSGSDLVWVFSMMKNLVQRLLIMQP